MRLFLLLSTLVLLVISPQPFAEDDEEGGVKEVAYVSLEPSLVANIQGRAKYARCDIQLMTNDLESLDDIKLHLPAIRHELLLLLSEQDGKILKTPDGKEQFRQQALMAIQKVIKEQTGKESINDLFFTSFFVQ